MTTILYFANKSNAYLGLMILCGLSVLHHIVKAAPRPDIHLSVIEMPPSNYIEPLIDTGFIARDPIRNIYVYWANGTIKRYPSAERAINLNGRLVEYIRWSKDGKKFIVGSSSGDRGRGWAWVVDSGRFVVLRKLAGNIAAAWFESPGIAFVASASHGQMYVENGMSLQLPRQIVVTASSDDGRFLLAETDLRHSNGWIGDLAIFHNLHGAMTKLVTVRRGIGSLQDSSELLRKGRNGSFLVTLCSNDGHIDTLCAAYYVDLTDHKITPLSADSDHRFLFFDFGCYLAKDGFTGICRVVDDQSGISQVPVTVEFQYHCLRGRTVMSRLQYSVIAFSADETGHEEYLVRQNGIVRLLIDP